MQEEKNIDVGEADEQETEIDLEAAPVEETPAEELVVEETKETKPVEEAPKDELGEYSEGVQKRIAKLTRKMREAERQKEEAITYAQTLKADQERLQSRYRNVETTYADEFKKRVTGSLEATKAKLQSAINNGDVEGQVAAQTELAQLTMDATRLARIEEMNKAAPVNESPVAQPRQEVPMQQPKTDPKADAWAAKNPWFGTDNAMTYTAFDIHKSLVEDEGYDPQSTEYYAEVDKRIRVAFPHKFDKVEESAPAPTQSVASAKRPASNKGRRKSFRGRSITRFKYWRHGRPTIRNT